MTSVWRLDLSPTDKMVLLALADAANDDGVCWTPIKARTPGKLDLLTKCSLSERAIQGAIKRLCESGLLSRLERPGKGVISTVTPASAIGDGCSYVYRIEDTETAEFYVGVTSCSGDPTMDPYMGSGAWFNKRRTAETSLRKSIVETFKTRSEAEAYERAFLEGVISDPLCRNERLPPKMPRNSCAPQQMRPAVNDLNPRSRCGETVSNPKIESISHARGSDFFSEFWSLYPRKKAKDAAHRAYLKALKGIDHGTILASLADQISWGVFDEPEFSPHAASWLNAGRWSDERDPTSRYGPRGHRLNHHDERKRAALDVLAEPGDDQREGQLSLIDGRGHPVPAPDAGGHYQRQPARR